MKQIAISEFRKLTIDEVKAQIPLALTADNVVFAYIVDISEVIVLSDLHPIIQNRLRMQEKRARSGMPDNEEITKADV